MLLKLYLILFFITASCTTLAGTLDSFESGLDPSSSSDSGDSSFFGSDSEDECLSIMGCVGDAAVNNTNEHSQSTVSNNSNQPTHFSLTLGSYFLNSDEIRASDLILSFGANDYTLVYEILKYKEEPINDSLRITYLSAAFPHMDYSSLKSEFMIGASMVQGNYVSQGMMLAYNLRVPFNHTFAIHLNPRVSLINGDTMSDIAAGITLTYHSLVITTGVRKLNIDDVDIKNGFVNVSILF